MEEHRNEVEKVDEMLLPGFRFHPTDEELVAFYLKWKIQQRPLSIELIKQLDIYKYNPWDLPKLASTGEKEWYFYCPRDRKYRNSARPNRVTGAGFWKATGTDRPIYSSEGNKCIGLKKSLVFYKGRAAKGIKTDWMMHEFRLPSLCDSAPNKRIMDKSIPANDSWAICRIFKKTNSTTQRVLSQSWASTLPECFTTSDHTLEKSSLTTQFTSQNMSLATENYSPVHLDYTISDLPQSSITNFSPLDHASTYKPPPPQLPISNEDITNNFFISPLETLAHTRCMVDVSSMLEGHSDKAIDGLNFGGSQQYHSNGFPLTTLPQVIQINVGHGDEDASLRNPNLINMEESQREIGSIHSSSIGFPLSFPMSMESIWRPNLQWDSPSFINEVSSSFSTAKCYT